MSALTGIRVLDLSTGIPGPYCARLLADAGADVVKIENPRSGGDPTRRCGTAMPTQGEDMTALYVYLNQNKRGIALDLAESSGRDVFRRLVAVADIVVESYEPGILAGWGLGYEELTAINERLILISITPYGQTGPCRHWKATHLTLAAHGGWAHLLGDPSREPLVVGFPMAYYVTGVTGGIAAVAALQGRALSDRGEHLDISTHDVVLRLYPHAITREQFSGQAYRRYLQFPVSVRASDGYAAVNALSPEHWRQTFTWLGLPELAGDDRLARDFPSRAEVAQETQSRLDEWASDKTREEIFKQGQDRRLPTAVPYLPSEIPHIEHFRERGFLRQVPQAGLEGVMEPGVPFISSFMRDTFTGAPRLGEHDREILSELVKSPSDTDD